MENGAHPCLTVVLSVDVYSVYIFNILLSYIINNWAQDVSYFDCEVLMYFIHNRALGALLCMLNTEAHPHYL